MSPLLVSLLAFVGVAALVGGVALLLGEGRGSRVEDRLHMLTGAGPGSAKEASPASLLSQPLDEVPNIIETLLASFGTFSLRRWIDQADVSLSITQFALVSAVTAVVGAVAAVVAGMGLIAAPISAALFACLPLGWISWRRKRRFKKFAAQLPDALELIARALRAGHSLAAGFDLVQQEMPAPIGSEFGRVFEEQNLGVPLEEALESLSQRIPNLDLRFFCTAVILQRQTGGDLAEILDKIGHLIRERFRIWGQVQALTGEGRLSGIVLLALPPVLFVAVYRLNPEYVMLLFRDPMGKQMLAGAIILQFLGALAIRKIVNIKV